jgi:membrane-associated phospholipid phosphatase
MTVLRKLSNWGFAIVTWFGLTFFHLQGQQNEPYHFSPGLDIALTGAGLLFSGTGHFIQSQTNGLLTAEINQLMADPNRPTGFATRSLSEQSDDFSDYLVYASGAGAASLLLDHKVRQRFWGIALMGVETIAITDGFTALAKGIVLQPRPYVYNSTVAIDTKNDRGARFSFFSGHTSFASGMCFFTAQVYSDLHPQSKWRLPIWIAAATVPAVTGYLRMDAGQHFAHDVIIGYTVGALVGMGVPWLHKRKWAERASLSVGPKSFALVVRF